MARKARPNCDGRMIMAAADHPVNGEILRAIAKERAWSRHPMVKS